MDRINKIGLPVVLIIMFSIVGIMKKEINENDNPISIEFIYTT